MKSFLAIALACCLPARLATEDPPHRAIAVGEESVLAIEDAAPIAAGRYCAPAPEAGGALARCFTIRRAVLTASIRRVSALSNSGRWM